MDDTRICNRSFHFSSEHCPTPQQRGFTLIELLVAITILAILSMAVPAFSDVIARASRDAAQSDFMTLLAVARGEAIQRQQRITLCRGDTSSCEGTDTSGDRVWEGVLVFVDEDQDRDYNHADDELLQYADFAGLVSVTWNRGDSLSYESDGSVTGNSNGTFTMTPSNSGSSASACKVVISLQGRARQECD